MPARQKRQMSQNQQNATKTHSDICESDRSQGRTRHAQMCTPPHRDRRRSSQTCGAAPALASRSTVSPFSRSCSRPSRRAVSRKGATRPRTPSPAHEGDGRHVKGRSEGMYERQRRAHGHNVPLTCAPHGGQPGRALGVEEVALVLSPAVSATPRPPAAGSRRLRRCATLLTRSVSSSRATPSQPCRRLRFIEICGALQVFGMIVLQEDYTRVCVTRL